MELRNRTRYLKQLISFQDTDLIKVVTSPLRNSLIFKGTQWSHINLPQAANGSGPLTNRDK